MVAGHSDPGKSGKSVFGTSALNESAAEASSGSPSLGAHGGDGMCRCKINHIGKQHPDARQLLNTFASAGEYSCRSKKSMNGSCPGPTWTRMM